MRPLAHLLLLLSALTLASCYPRCSPLEPTFCYTLSPREVGQLRSPFPPLPPAEKSEPWAIELRIGMAFAKELDLYRAITAFQRALILLPPGHERELQLHYEILLAYYLGGRTCEALNAFEQSPLAFIDSTFPALKELLLILVDCYQHEGQPERAAGLLLQLEQIDPEEAAAVRLSSAIERVDWPELELFASSISPPPQLDCLMERYCTCRKSERRAELLAAALPGAGYWYVGQKQAAITSALLNGLFIWASYAFFRNDYIAAGIITTSLELGWYFGGIYGSAAAAHTYNERVWECEANPYLRHYRLFPALRLSYGF